MMLALETIGLSQPLVVGVVEAYAAHNELWFAHERAQGRHLTFEWFKGLRYLEPPSRDVWRIRDAGMLIAAGVGECGELAAAMVGWLRAADRPAELVVSRPQCDTWHVRVLERGLLWDPSKAVRRAA